MSQNGRSLTGDCFFVIVAPQIPVAGANGTSDSEAHLTAPVMPAELKTSTDKPILNATPCPINPNLVSILKVRCPVNIRSYYF
jgi:hypothetical protein